jgi:PIN domain nuclease of toxin-antitoxin system
MGAEEIDFEEAARHYAPKRCLLDKDPFDRMLVAQARVENMLLVTSDKKIQAYDVRTVW